MLTIKKNEEGLFEAVASPPHVEKVWVSPGGYTAAELAAMLVDLGCHPRDVGDAFYEPDPDWLEE